MLVLELNLINVFVRTLQQEKKAEAACLREHQKLRHRMKIKEVESSSEEEDDKTTSGGKTKKCHLKEGTLSGIPYSFPVRLDVDDNTCSLNNFKTLKSR